MSVSLNVQNVLRNTALTFGVAFAAAAATKLVNQVAHRYWKIEPHIWYSPSLVIRQAAAIAGGAVTYALATRATLVSFPVDSTFLKHHCLHLLFGAYLGVNGILIYSKENLNGTLAYGALASLLCLSANATGPRNSLFAAGAVGVMAGLRV